jgi:hydrogenase maturation protein HypF
MELEFAIESEETEQVYLFEIVSGATMTVDWEPLIRAILEDARHGIPLARISRKFHNTLVEIIVAVARLAGEKRVVLTGGCFQNKFLIEHSVQRLEQEGFKPYWHQRIPPNDGGIALGQIVAASRILRGLES